MKRGMKHGGSTKGAVKADIGLDASYGGFRRDVVHFALSLRYMEDWLRKASLRPDEAELRTKFHMSEPLLAYVPSPQPNIARIVLGCVKAYSSGDHRFFSELARRTKAAKQSIRKRGTSDTLEPVLSAVRTAVMISRVQKIPLTRDLVRAYLNQTISVTDRTLGRIVKKYGFAFQGAARNRKGDK